MKPSRRRCATAEAATAGLKPRRSGSHKRPRQGSANLNRAYKRVKGNGGSAGVDGMTVEDLLGWIAAHRETLIARLLDGSYQPRPVPRFVHGT
jgi:retron-type reverse transcriptase